MILLQNCGEGRTELILFHSKLKLGLLYNIKVSKVSVVCIICVVSTDTKLPLNLFILFQKAKEKEHGRHERGSYGRC